MKINGFHSKMWSERCISGCHAYCGTGSSRTSWRFGPRYQAAQRYLPRNYFRLWYQKLNSVMSAPFEPLGLVPDLVPWKTKSKAFLKYHLQMFYFLLHYVSRGMILAANLALWLTWWRWGQPEWEHTHCKENQ